MDLERVGSPELGAQFLHWYRGFSAVSYPDALAHHYIAYRAHVRAKVACLRFAQGPGGAVDTAPQLLAMTEAHLRRGRVVLVLVGGLPGTGKSTLAGDLAESFSWAMLRSDEIRKDLAGIGHLPGQADPYRQGLYDERSTSATYETMLQHARSLLESGRSVVLDASWSDRRWRDAAETLARATSSELVGLRCEAPPDVARTRMARRRALGSDPSDATSDVSARMAGTADPWPTATSVDTTLTRDRTLAVARARIEEGPNEG